ncbi:sugar phosphate isomerase/epimerase family protein [Parasphaerochaeta coccoides]|uniref:Xylose isomerase domain-containing protein TIM barrel n=1 Tax=Parasphaerochaeta coccoides (strain ATCC BAA-1237 / DSM 17374 / SPN1) TaxID=760011 RepID=F4GI22_PARC1|nr:sugar phosphate isomerase/epimerase family protein [Parasphaerochaeta coccoides]AEC02620.1 Xylose isomerase domain-containing protein TIM barrel [Parasphaerochaeta coccoides DSM 17374]
MKGYMKGLATSTNIISFRRSGGHAPMISFMDVLSAHGWKNLDLNFCEMMNPESTLRTEESSVYLERLMHLREKHGFVYMQSHAPYVRDRFAMKDDEGRESDVLMAKAIRISASLGIPHVVVHPAPLPSDRPRREIISRNVAWLSPFVELASGLGVALALENLDAENEIHDADELCTLADAFGKAPVGICYDFGHANMHGKRDHAAFLRTVGKRLTATHVADNNGTEDEHLLPFHGTIAWEECLPILSGIGYDGYLTYEIMFFSRHLPEQTKGAFLDYALATGNHLMELAAKPTFV